MIPLDPLQAPGAVLGMMGAVTGNPYVVVMFGFYWVTAVVGVVNQFGRERPKMEGNSEKMLQTQKSAIACRYRLK